ncbi:GntR family transcriptional regulator [Oceanibacterium hippocampi]|uniref:Putative HTH-type transcriptional regulator YidP n=1 Tax=Oceanibacterium hippocampi TaxID=745714 RepID=A0A1Y5TT37_9PROT|nr:GntR family transcriptional regulator [Oceanibacterium hippocampi]SLN71436.1 putative HTH-type transcriptional regulator YidP [Oceanibacterium hippocampi]
MSGGANLPEGGKARRVYLLLRDALQNGAYVAGASLPGEQRLAETYSVSRATVRRALDALAADGMVDKRTGSGSTVRAPANAASTVSADFSTLIPQLTLMGQSTTARLLSFAYGPAPEGVASAMGLPGGERVQTAVRVRLFDGKPLSYLTTYVPESIARNYTEADLATTPLYRLLERSGVKVDTAHQSVTATLASPDVAEALDVSAGSPLLSLRRVVRDKDGRGVEYLWALYLADVFRLEMNLSRVAQGSERHWAPVIGGRANGETTIQ